MSEQEEVVNSVVTNIVNIVTSGTAQLGAAANTYGPEVLDVAEKYVRTLAIISSIHSFIILFISLILAKIIYKFFMSDKGDDFAIPIIILGFIITLLSIFSFLELISVDNILSIVSPKLELIKMAKDIIVQKATPVR